MRAAVALRDVVGEAQHGFMKTVVPGQRELDPDAGRRIVGDRTDARIEHWHLGTVEIFDEGAQPALVEQVDHHGRRVALVADRDAQARIKERQFAQAAFEDGKIVFDFGECAAAGLEGDFGALVLVGRADHDQRSHRVAVFEPDEMFQPTAPDSHFHPLGQSVHHRRTHAVQSARHLVGVLVEFAARVQPGQHHFGRRHAFLGMHVSGDAAPVVAHGDRSVAVQHQADVFRVARLRLVHRVVDDLERHVVQARAVIGVADIHPRPLAHRI